MHQNFLYVFGYKITIVERTDGHKLLPGTVLGPVVFFNTHGTSPNLRLFVAVLSAAIQYSFVAACSKAGRVVMHAVHLHATNCKAHGPHFLHSLTRKIDLAVSATNHHATTMSFLTEDGGAIVSPSADDEWEL